MTRDLITCGKPWEASALFSLGVGVEGKLLFTAGMTARDPEGRVVGAGDMRRQVEQCFENIGDVLRAAGARWEQVVKVTMYVTDFDAFEGTRDIRARYLRGRPAATAVGVSRLIHPDMMFDIEAVAVLD
ncbi:RidA family protein [Desertibaculum subflavum]|uniref:RidA family protein n=1 Tax=Desertibaculum subflavum TaxID=2268458 RepID=UPI0013C47030